MKRKSFLSSIIPLGAVLTGMAKGEEMFIPDKFSVIPPYLKEGDVIGITSPAGYISLEDIQPAIKTIEGWGYTVKVGNAIGKRDFTFGGTDEERLEDLQEMLHDKDIKAIMCARGGYGLVRIIDKINFTEFKKYPKWIIGFSDITVLHNHINRNYKISTIHSKMCNSFPEDFNNAELVQRDSIHSIQDCLSGEQMNYSFTPNLKNRTGIAEGFLVGGNLRTIETLAGTISDLVTKNKILFIEDTGEYLYSIDRMMWNLKRTGKLSNLAGLIVGGFNPKKDDVGEEFGKTIEEIVLEKVSNYNYPVGFNFPVGHQKNNMALKCGAKHKIVIDINECSLTEIR